MRWIFSVAVVAASSAFLYHEYQAMNTAQAVAQRPQPPAAPDPPPFLSPAELKGVRRSTLDGDPGVRWTAIELLFAVRDPDSLKILEDTVQNDPDTDVRLKAVALLDKGGSSKQVPGLVKALNDLDKDVRIAALKALGDIGDPAAAPWVTTLLKDPEADVKTEALHTLGRFQDKRVREFQDLTDQLRRQYETAVKKSQQATQ